MEARQNGTLEAMLVSETPLTMILGASAAYPFVLLYLRTAICAIVHRQEGKAAATGRAA